VQRAADDSNASISDGVDHAYKTAFGGLPTNMLNALGTDTDFDRLWIGQRPEAFAAMAAQPSGGPHLHILVAGKFSRPGGGELSGTTAQLIAVKGFVIARLFLSFGGSKPLFHLSENLCEFLERIFPFWLAAIAIDGAFPAIDFALSVLDLTEWVLTRTAPPRPGVPIAVGGTLRFN
jgi:hypothetical protein